MKTVRGWIAALGHDAARVDLEGTPAWMLAAHARELRDLTPKRSVRLLPAFDHYVVAASRHAVHLLSRLAGGASIGRMAGSRRSCW
jgi:hypothetical protein